MERHEKDNLKILKSIIHQDGYTNKLNNFPKSKLRKDELSNIQSLTNASNLHEVAKNIMSNQSNDEWYLKGKDSLKRGSPTSAHLIWLQCQNSSHLDLKSISI